MVPEYTENVEITLLSTEHVFACPAILAALQNLGEYPLQGVLYSGKIAYLADEDSAILT